MSEKCDSSKITLEDNNYYLFNKDFDASSTGDAIRFIIEKNFIEKNKPKNIIFCIRSLASAHNCIL